MKSSKAHECGRHGACKRNERKKDEGTSSSHDKKKEIRSVGHTIGKKKELRNRKPKFTNFTPLIMPIEQVLMQIRDDPSLQWLKPISSRKKRQEQVL